MSSAVPKSDEAIKRPGFVWVILVLYGLGLMLTLGSIYAVFSGVSNYLLKKQGSTLGLEP